MKFDELLAQQLSMRFAYRKRRARRAPALRANGRAPQALLKELPFELTAAQKRAVKEVLADLAGAAPDAAAAAGRRRQRQDHGGGARRLQAVENGRQAAVMAPTEILAEQHWRKFTRVARAARRAHRVAARRADAQGAGRGARVDLRGRMRHRRSARTRCSRKACDSRSLALAIVDEQHRFGVQQRLALRRKAARRRSQPHQLMMSATPIPRTLSMTYYADLDVSVIDELPPGRAPVATRLVPAARRDEVLARIRDACAEGQQAYWVCPLIEESEGRHLQTALDTLRELRAELPEPARRPAARAAARGEKAAVMEEFKAGRIQLLVAPP